MKLWPKLGSVKALSHDMLLGHARSDMASRLLNHLPNADDAEWIAVGYCTFKRKVLKQRETRSLTRLASLG